MRGIRTLTILAAVSLLSVNCTNTVGTAARSMAVQLPGAFPGFDVQASGISPGTAALSCLGAAIRQDGGVPSNILIGHGAMLTKSAGEKSKLPNSLLPFVRNAESQIGGFIFVDNEVAAQGGVLEKKSNYGTFHVSGNEALTRWTLTLDGTAIQEDFGEIRSKQVLLFFGPNAAVKTSRIDVQLWISRFSEEDFLSHRLAGPVSVSVYFYDGLNGISAFSATYLGDTIVITEAELARLKNGSVIDATQYAVDVAMARLFGGLLAEMSSIPLSIWTL